MNIGERIKQRRTELGLSVDEVASRLGKNRATIYRYENNNIENFPITVLEPLAKILNTTPAYLMGWEKEMFTSISKELKISTEALYSINAFSLTIDKKTEYSMMDIFNAMVIHKNFYEIVKEMLLYISRSEDEWQKMIDYLSDSNIMKSVSKDSIKAFCRSNITDKFEKLIFDILSSDINSFDKVIKRDSNKNITLKTKPQKKNLTFSTINRTNDIKTTKEIDNFDNISNDSTAGNRHEHTELAKEFFTDPNEARKYLEMHQIAAFNGIKNLSDESIIQMANIAKSRSTNLGEKNEGDINRRTI